MRRHSRWDYPRLTALIRDTELNAYKMHCNRCIEAGRQCSPGALAGLVLDSTGALPCCHEGAAAPHASLLSDARRACERGAQSARPAVRESDTEQPELEVAQAAESIRQAEALLICAGSAPEGEHLPEGTDAGLASATSWKRRSFHVVLDCIILYTIVYTIP